MNTMLDKKYSALQSEFASLGKAAVAYSGGADSALALRVAHDVLGENAVAIMAVTPLVSKQDVEYARRIASDIGASLIETHIDVLEIDGVSSNSQDRCYFCKSAIFNAVRKAAEEWGGSDTVIVDGSNVDDASEFRPGEKALRELEVLSPLRESGLTKQDVRELSRELGLTSWDKPSNTCLATRIPYDTPLDASSLEMIDAAELALHGEGFDQLRVRKHDDMARIEVEPSQIHLLLEDQKRERIARRLHELGFTYVSVDLEGFRSGSMARGLPVNPEES